MTADGPDPWRVRHNLLLEHHAQQAADHANEVTTLRMRHMAEVQALQRRVVELLPKEPGEEEEPDDGRLEDHDAH
jgi:hypothetical protein